MELFSVQSSTKIEQRFETFTKVGTGFTDADAKEIDSLLSEHIIADAPKDVFIKSRMLPDIFVEPAVVIEVSWHGNYRKPRAYRRRGRRRDRACFALSPFFTHKIR